MAEAMNEKDEGLETALIVYSTAPLCNTLVSTMKALSDEINNKIENVKTA